MLNKYLGQSYPYTEQVMQLPHSNIHMLHVGNTKDPCVMMIIGHDGSLYMWLKLARVYLEQGFSVLLINLPGCGKAKTVPLPKQSRPIIVKDWLSDIMLLLDRLSIDSVDLVGACLGGSLAQIIAVAYPCRINSLTLIGTSINNATSVVKTVLLQPLFFLHLMWRQRKIKRSTTTKAHHCNRYRFYQLVFSNRQNIWGQLSSMLSKKYFELKHALPLDEDFVRDIINSGDFDPLTLQSQSLQQFDQVMDQWFKTDLKAHQDRLRTLKVPTLIVHGIHDRIIDIKAAYELNHVIPNSQLMIYDGNHFIDHDMVATHGLDLVRYARSTHTGTITHKQP